MTCAHWQRGTSHTDSESQAGALPAAAHTTRRSSAAHRGRSAVPGPVLLRLCAGALSCSTQICKLGDGRRDPAQLGERGPEVTGIRCLICLRWGGPGGELGRDRAVRSGQATWFSGSICPSLEYWECLRDSQRREDSQAVDEGAEHGSQRTQGKGSLRLRSRPTLIAVGPRPVPTALPP